MRNRRLIRALVFAFIVLVGAWSAVAGEINAIWIWEEDTFRMLDEPDWRAEVLTALERDGINTLYLYADSYRGRSPIADETDLYEAAIEDAHHRGFRVEALLGSAYLSTNRYVMPDKRDAARTMLERVIAYNNSKKPTARFDALHLDIEPYTIPEWKSDRQAVATHFVDAAKEWQAIAHRDGSRIEIGAAIPFWFDGVEREGGSLAQALLETFDYVALMDYRDKAEGGDGIIEHARDEIELADRIGKKVVIGVETGQSELDKLSFAEEGRSVMERELKKVREEYRGKPGYAGIAIHHLSPYLALKD